MYMYIPELDPHEPQQNKHEPKKEKKEERTKRLTQVKKGKKKKKSPLGDSDSEQRQGRESESLRDLGAVWIKKIYNSSLITQISSLFTHFSSLKISQKSTYPCLAP